MRSDSVGGGGGCDTQREGHGGAVLRRKAPVEAPACRGWGWGGAAGAARSVGVGGGGGHDAQREDHGGTGVGGRERRKRWG